MLSRSDSDGPTEDYLYASVSMASETRIDGLIIDNFVCKTVEKLAEHLQSMPFTVLGVQFSAELMSSVQTDELSKILSVLCTRFSSFRFNLEENYQYGLVIVFDPNLLSNDVLDLSDTQLGLIPAWLLIAVFAALPANFKYLLLQNNHLYMQGAFHLGEIFRSLSPEIDYLDVSNNGLNNLPTFGLAYFLNSLSASIRDLILCNNSLSKFPFLELGSILRILSNLVGLDLRDNGLEKLLAYQVYDLFNELTRLNIKLNVEPAFFAKLLVHQVAENITINLPPSFLFPSKTNINFDDSNLVVYANFLSGANVGIASLTCGLLLARRIIMGAEFDRPGKLSTISEFRMHSALAHFAQAAQDPLIKRTVDMIFWDIATNPNQRFESVKQRLQALSIVPPDEPLISILRRPPPEHVIPIPQSLSFFTVLKLQRAKWVAQERAENPDYIAGPRMNSSK